MEFKHISVLLKESVDLLCVQPDGIYVDGTLGGGGHSELILNKLDSGGRLIGIDRDITAVKAASERLKAFDEKFVAVHDNFRNIKSILENLNISKIDGAILDLGVSSPQLDDADRGFSYNKDARLDMRMNREDALTAFEVVNTYPEERLKTIIYRYGEERFAGAIARKICEARSIKTIETTFQLSDIIKSAMPKKERLKDKHPAKKTFQAIRIEVNGELELLKPAIDDFVSVLKPGGVLAVITFHSLEDRIVKEEFSHLAKGCECPKDFPVCVCGKKPIIELINKKPVISGQKELSENYRAHSAKLRAARKLQ